MSETEDGGNKPPKDGNDVKNGSSAAKAIRIACAVVAALFAAASLVCIACYAVYRADVLFIPIALCAVVSLISFTYFRNTKG